ncbi:MAG: sensor histidine kinase [Magnetococcales bacterium]|nr:sensor histidine kinase [Magnetococcales bacterium]
MTRLNAHWYESRSLTNRLVVGSVVWIVLSLAITGVWMVSLFEDSMTRRFEQELDDHLLELVAAAEWQSGSIKLGWEPADPRFHVAFSGWYWEIQTRERSLLRSRSWTGQYLRASSADWPAGEKWMIQQNGPNGQPMGILAQAIHLPDGEQPLLFLIAGPLEGVKKESRAFAGQLVGMLLVLAVALIGAVVLQVRFGLIPLMRLRKGLADIRSGEQQRLIGEFPQEVAPLVEEMNALLSYQHTLLERVRSQSGDLAHALKNPLAILRNEAQSIPGELGDGLREGLAAISGVLEDRLIKARIAGTGNLLTARCDVAEVISGLCLSLDRLYSDKNLQFTLTGIEGLLFRGDCSDLEELLGNLLDNACKWGTSQVRVQGARERERFFSLTIHDDGPGILAKEGSRLIRRGQRLDETVPGSGLGLSIAANLAALYHGDLRLEESPLGGLAVVVILPLGAE